MTESENLRISEIEKTFANLPELDTVIRQLDTMKTMQ